MRKSIFRITLLILLALTPLLYFLFRQYLPLYNRRPLVYEILFFAPYVIYTITAFLGIKLNQTRIFFSSLLWGMLYYIITTNILPFTDIQPDKSVLAKFISVFSILIIVLLYAFKEKYIFSLHGILRMVLLFIPLSLTVLLANLYKEDSYPVLAGNLLFHHQLWFLPDIILLVTIGLFLIFLLQKDKSIQHFKSTIVICLIPLIIALNFTAGKVVVDYEMKIFNALSFLIMGFLFLYALFRMYWEKVYIDELTGIANRRAFDEYLKRLGRKYTIAMIDIDHFKKFNDIYGHSEGDNVLRYVATHISEESGGQVFRYGGEEFSVIYKGERIKNVFWRLEQMRDDLSRRRFSIRAPQEVRKLKSEKDRKKNQSNIKMIRVTISIGVAQRTPLIKLPHDVINAADEALYRAKGEGRNRTIIARGMRSIKS